MKLGISSYSFPWSAGIEEYGSLKRLSPFSLLDHAIHYAVGFIQFGDNLPLHQLSPSALELLKNKATEAAVGIEVGARGMDAENLGRYLCIAKKLGSPFLRLVIDDAGFHPEEAEVITRIKAILPQLRENNIILAIENHDRFPARSLERIIRQTDPEWVGICLDTANSLGAGEGVQEVINILAQYTVNLHLKDFSIRRTGHKMGFRVEGRPAGEGLLDIPSVISQIKQKGRCYTATLEVWSDPEETIEATLQKEKEWVERSLAYLKQIIT